MRARSWKQRLGLVSVIVVIELIVFAGVAAGRADVSFSTASDALTIFVNPVDGTGNDGQYKMFVAPFKDDSRNGFRVGQISSSPRIATFDGDCFENAAFNDVVCSPGRGAITVTMGDQGDVVRVRETQSDESGFECVDDVQGTFLVTINLGQGNDDLKATENAACGDSEFPDPGFFFRLKVEGGDGRDTIIGTNLRGEGQDALEDQLGDTLNGGGEDDVLKGLGGNDVIFDEFGNDEVDGGSGDDTLISGRDDDRLIGGPGVDTVSYSGRGLTVLVSLTSTTADDGEITGENDDIRDDVENVEGGEGNDTLEGSQKANKLLGRGGRDVLRGNSSDDTLDGGPGRDELDGGTGRDTYAGGADNDSLGTRDGTKDVISCGAGTADKLESDLKDPKPRDCESIIRFAVDDGPPGYAAGRELRVADGKASIEVRCPRNARVACRGKLTVRTLGAGDEVIGRADYDARLGGRTVVPVSLRGPDLDDGTPLSVETVEQGASEKGPRTAIRRFATAATTARSPTSFLWVGALILAAVALIALLVRRARARRV